ncbi:rho GTPase-activating protein 7-like isoform X1 [Centruroides sculpturatus]|uniref:rho GTPase-activating protein 7-like isoform X1 n=1 Tax=Centruroides sculpturatus TaxID=218467 RepID=UPI000C6D3954|nr:rho GTPase-activating protein 7-like isoform X1 [Centruroides sculpturatus]
MMMYVDEEDDSSPRSSVSWMSDAVNAFMNRRFIRSFSERISGNKYRGCPLGRAERWWKKVREHRLTELEALEACSWLRAAGFPQYAQMYEDNLFPIDISSVKKDHEFLDTDSIQSLFRRLNTLNKCARMKIDNVPRKSFLPDDSDEDDFCALSENWQFQRSSRRWSRVPPPLLNSNNLSNSTKNCVQSPTRKFQSSDDVYSSSHDSVFIEDQQSSPDSLRKALSIHYEEDIYVPSSPIPMEEDLRPSGSGSGSSPSFGSDVTLEKQSELLDISRGLRRTGSERLRESAKALLRRMESLRGKRKKKNRHAVIIGGTQNMNESGMDHNHANISASPQLIHHTFLRNYPSDEVGQGDDSDCSQCSTPQFKHRKRGWRILNRSDVDSVVHSDSECPNSSVNYQWKDANSNDTHENHPQIQNGSLKRSDEIHKSSGNQKLNKRERNYLTPQSAEKEDRLSVYDNVPAPLAMFDDAFDQQDDSETIENGSDERNALRIRTEDVDSGSMVSSMACNSDKDITDHHDTNGYRERRDSGVGLSLTRSGNNGQSWWHCFPHRQSSVGIRQSFSSGLQLNSLSAPQLMVLRKLSLLKLTTLMEKYSPSSRSGWNWAVPKFIRKMRTPDYKDKVVFGVPLLLVLQRSGQPLPSMIETAIRHLQNTSLNCTGLFRKSGVRSRIQKLRNLNETNPDSSIYENQQAYDIADMLKQYFRELPEALLTNKLSEIFLTIFQHIPEELRKEATQAAILLMPDENREVLQSLLSFLQDVSFHSEENQMTATNLAVCFAPSLFHLNTPRSASASPRRSKTVGVPDQRELNENRAAHECLTHMIKEYKNLFTISEDMLGHCRSLYLEEWEPATLEDLGKTSFMNDGNWKAYVDNCIQGLLKEARDKFKGWIPIPQSDVEIAYKKLTDRHPLRLWKVSVEVEAPPIELLNRILRERHIWDDSLLKWRVVCRLDKQSEIFQYVCASLTPHPPRDYCVLRSWQTDLPKGTCVLIETSVEHSDAPMMLGGVRGVALASHYLIEPCGSGKSRITYISRIDTRGRTPEWYNKAYGQLCALKIIRLKNSFAHGTEGPETKV